MKYRWGAAGSSVAIVTMAAWLILRGGGGGEPAPSTIASPAHSGRAALGRPAPPAGQRIAGIVELDGAPVAGIGVRLASTVSEEQRVTDASGRFDFGSVPARAYVVSAQVEKLTGAVRALDLRRIDERSDDLHLVLHACDTSIHGVVRDVSGGVIPNARVAHALDGDLADLAALTGADGTYELCVPPGNTTMQVSADGYATITTRLPAFGRSRHDVELPPGAIVHGRVVHAGVAVGGAELTLSGSSAGRRTHATADADGRFQFSGELVGNHELSATADGLATPRALSIIAQVGGGADVVVELAPAFAVEGKVVEDGTAKGVAGIDVMLVGEAGTRDAVTDAGGGFAFTSVPAGEYMPYVAVESRRYPQLVVAAEVRGVALAVGARFAIAGRITHKHQPIEGAMVSTGSAQTLSDHAGRFSVQLAAGTHSLYAESLRVGAFARVPLEVSRPRSDVEVELDLAASIAGTVVDQDGAPVAGVLVECRKPSDNDYGAATTAENGAFTAPSLSGGGTYGCTVNRSDHAQRFPLADGATEVQVPLADGTSAVTGVRIAVRVEHLRLAGKVLDASGAPLPDAQVRASSSYGMLNAYTDVAGAFAFRDLPKTTFHVRVHSPHGTATLDDVEAGRTDLVLQLPATGSLDGTLIGFARPPWILVMRRSGPYEEHPIAPSATGFHVDDLAAGDYMVSATTSDAVAKGTVSIVAGQVARLVLTGLAAGRIQGMLRDAVTHEPMTNSFCTAMAGEQIASGHTDGNGAYVITGVFAGTNLVSCDRDPTTHEVEVVAGKTTHVDFEAQPEKRVHLGFALEDRGNQVFVKSVEADSPAARAGIATGDRLVKLGDNPIYPPSQGLVPALESVAGAQGIPLLLDRGGKSVTVLLTGP